MNKTIQHQAARAGARLSVFVVAMGAVAAAQATPSCDYYGYTSYQNFYNEYYNEYCSEENAYQTSVHQQANQNLNILQNALFGVAQRAASTGSGRQVAANGSVMQGLAAGGGDSRWSVWGGANHSSMGYSFQPMRSSGYGNVLLGGVDYTFAGNIIVGAALTAEQSRIKTGFNGGRVTGNGYSLAPYIAVPFASNWVVDASIGYGRSDIENRVAGVSNSVDVDRVFRALSLSYFRDSGRWQYSAKASYLASEDRFGKTATVAGERFRMEQLRLGGQAAYDLGSLQPFVGVYYINDIGSTRQDAVALQTPDNDRDAWQIQLGLNFVNRGPFSGGLTAFSEVGRSQVRNDAIMANVSYRF